MHLLMQALWGHILKHTLEKSQTNATSVSMHPMMQAIWGYIWKRTVEKNQTYATNVTMPLLHLRTHFKIHSGEKSNKCNQCDFASSYASALRTHLKIHSGEKSKCNQCDYASSDASNLRTHLKTHSGEKPNNVTMPPLRQALWGHKFTVEKSQTSTTNVTLYLWRPAIWGDIWKRTVKTNLTMHFLTVWICLMDSWNK